MLSVQLRQGEGVTLSYQVPGCSTKRVCMVVRFAASSCLKQQPAALSAPAASWCGLKRLEALGATLQRGSSGGGGGSSGGRRRISTPFLLQLQAAWQALYLVQALAGALCNPAALRPHLAALVATLLQAGTAVLAAGLHAGQQTLMLGTLRQQACLTLAWTTASRTASHWTPHPSPPPLCCPGWRWWRRPCGRLQVTHCSNSWPRAVAWLAMAAPQPATESAATARLA